jgi:BREX protein BrxB
MSLTDPMAERLSRDLEPVLSMPDPRSKLSAYHDMPYAIFRYDPDDELDLRRNISLLETRLSQKAKQITRISLAEALDEAMRLVHPLAEWFAAEREQDTGAIVDTIHSVLSDYQPLVNLVAERMPPTPDPLRDLVFIVRTGALFPVYRTFSLLEQLKGRVVAPTVLFYPGTLDGAAGLSFMGVLEAEHNYRPKIF